MEKQTYDTIDFMKLGMAFLVVAIHCRLGGLNALGRLAVPFFFIASSYFFFYKYLPSQRKNYEIKRYLKRILLLYATWQVIYLPFGICTVAQEMGGGRSSCQGIYYYFDEILYLWSI